MEYRYSVDNASFEDSYAFKTNFSEDNPEWVAEEAAKDYHSNHDGWEDSWPLDFELFTAAGVSLGVFTVEREAVPSFSATEKEAEK